MFAALHVPDFPVASILRTGGGERPCAVLAGEIANDAKGKLPILSLNRAARFAGLQAGWPLNRALVRCPDLRVLPRDVAAEAAVSGELAALGESLTPDFEWTAADLVTLDLSGWRSVDASVFGSLALPGVELWHVLAETPDLAGLAVRHEEMRGRWVRSSDLAAMPLGLLHTLANNPQAWSVLELWGLKTFGDFMALPRQALSERLGAEAGRWHDMLHGKSCRLLRLHRPPESLLQRMDFEDSVVSLEPLVFIVKRLLHTLTGRLASRHLAARSLVLRLHLEAGGTVSRVVRLPEPRNTTEGMWAPLQTWLDSLQADSAITALELDAETTFAMAAQREWFGRQLPQPERWAETLAKLEALLGPGRVGIPVPPESHHPEAFDLLPAIGGRAAMVAENRAKPSCPVPLSRYRPPVEIAVAHELRGNHPAPLALLSGPHPGRVIDARGPFPASGCWWEPAEAWQRLEWDVRVDGHPPLRLVLQPPDRWQLDGIYR
jgi:protein ImuB